MFSLYYEALTRSGNVLCMHQISLLGGLGNAPQTMRPDRVYATGVLSPMVGFRPGLDVMANAQAFTTGPNTGMTLSGLRGLRGWDKVKAWWQGVKMRASGAMPNFHAAAAAQPGAASTTATEPQVHAPGASTPPRTGWGGEVNAHGYSMAPAIATAHHLGPYGRGIPAGMVTAAYGQSTSLPPFAAEAASKTTMMMWRGLRFPWG